MSITSDDAENETKPKLNSRSSSVTRTNPLFGSEVTLGENQDEIEELLEECVGVDTEMKPHCFVCTAFAFLRRGRMAPCSIPCQACGACPRVGDPPPPHTHTHTPTRAHTHTWTHTRARR